MANKRHDDNDYYYNLPIFSADSCHWMHPGLRWGLREQDPRRAEKISIIMWAVAFLRILFFVRGTFSCESRCRHLRRPMALEIPEHWVGRRRFTEDGHGHYFESCAEKCRQQKLQVAGWHCLQAAKSSLWEVCSSLCILQTERSGVGVFCRFMTL